MTDPNNPLTRSLRQNSDYNPSLDPRNGTLIPSPRLSHTHALVMYPFNPNTLFSNHTVVFYPKDYAIENFPLDEQARLHAGQAVVVREMKELRRHEREWMRVKSLRELVLSFEKEVGEEDLNLELEVGQRGYWRGMLGWAGAGIDNTQKSRCSTSLPTKTTLQRGITDKYVWSHELGQWKHETWSGVEHDRRERICSELERIDELRYLSEDCWARDIDRELAQVRAAPGTKKKPPTMWFDDSKKGEHEDKTPKRACRRKEVSGSQTTSVFSGFLSVRDAKHKIRSQTPEPESQPQAHIDSPSQLPRMKSSELEPAVEFQLPITMRFPFLLDITKEEGQREKWVEFLEQHGCNGAMISALRRFFCGGDSRRKRSALESMKFLGRLRRVCEEIEEVQVPGTEGLDGGRKWLLRDD